MVTVRDHFYQKLNWILSAQPDMTEMVFRARAVSQMDPIFPQLIRMACIADEKICGIPEGVPEGMKFEILPDGIADTTIRQEIRRIRKFQARGEMQGLSKAKREGIWIQLLEGVHPKEAEILTQIKDQTLFAAYPILFDLMKELTGQEVDLPRPEKDSPKSEEPTLVVGALEELATEQTALESETPPQKRKAGRPKKEG